jgi:hypothetical protein
LLAFEYGLTPDKAIKLTRREISELLDGMASRKMGYPESEEAVTLETNPLVDEKIKRLNGERFNGR